MQHLLRGGRDNRELAVVLVTRGVEHHLPHDNRLLEDHVEDAKELVDVSKRLVDVSKRLVGRLVDLSKRLVVVSRRHSEGSHSRGSVVVSKRHSRGLGSEEDDVASHQKHLLNFKMEKL